MSEDDKLDKELLKAEVEERLEDLKFEYDEDDELSEVKIYKQLRDEFDGEEYKEALVELGINSKNLGLTEIKEKDTSNSSLLNKDDKHLQTLVKVLLDATPHIKRVDKRIRGYEEEEDGKWKRKLLILVPAKERIRIISFLESIFMAQNLIAKKNLTIKEYESRMNKQLQEIRVRLENYPDHIVKPGTIKYVNGILLGEVSVVLNSIETGKLAEAATDILTGSYNERTEPIQKNKKEELQEFLRL